MTMMSTSTINLDDIDVDEEHPEQTPLLLWYLALVSAMQFHNNHGRYLGVPAASE